MINKHLFWLLTFIWGFLNQMPVANAGSRILATGGVVQAEGSAGSGLVPWAVIAGYSHENEYDLNFYTTKLETDDFDFSMQGASVGIDNRYEISFAKQKLGLGPLQAALGLPDNHLKQDILGVKVKAFGDLIYDDIPQVSVGIQYKKLDDFTIPQIAGAVDEEGTDFYISASRLWLDGVNGYPLLANLTLRSTRANQLGLLGFGGDVNDSRETQVEFNANIILHRDWVLGYDYRQKPDNLSFAKEDDWQDIYLAWFYDKSISVVFAWVDFKSVAGIADQQGPYVSLQVTL